MLPSVHTWHFARCRAWLMIRNSWPSSHRPWWGCCASFAATRSIGSDTRGTCGQFGRCGWWAPDNRRRRGLVHRGGYPSSRGSNPGGRRGGSWSGGPWPRSASPAWSVGFAGSFTSSLDAAFLLEFTTKQIGIHVFQVLDRKYDFTVLIKEFKCCLYGIASCCLISCSAIQLFSYNLKF